MTLQELFTLTFWNSLVRDHMSEVILVLTAALVTLSDRYVRRIVNKLTTSRGKLLRFAAFLLLVSVGYTGLTLGFAYLLRKGLWFEGGVFMAPFVVGALLLISFEAGRQKHV